MNKQQHSNKGLNKMNDNYAIMLDALRLAEKRIAFMSYKVDGWTLKKDALVEIEGQNAEGNLEYISEVIDLFSRCYDTKYHEAI